MYGRSRLHARPASLRGGFTLLEAVLVLMIVGLLAGVVAPAVSSTRQRMSVDNSRNAAIFLSARARALASNRGTTAVLEFDGTNDRAWVRMGADTLNDTRVDFKEDYGADLDYSGTLTVCYSSKGYALFSCSSGSFPATLTFDSGPNSGSVVVRPLGQIEKVE